MNIESLTGWLFLNIPLASLFLYLYIRKDKMLEEKNQHLLDTYNKNIEIQEKVKASIDTNTEAIRANTRLTERTYDFFTHRNGSG